MLSADTLRLKAEMLLANMSKEQRDALIDVVNNKTINATNHVITFLIKQGWIVQKKDKYMLTIPYLEHILRTQSNADLISESLLFTKLESILFDYLKKNINKIITRAELAIVIWEEEWEEQYSDWAIDQLVYKIRKKMMKGNLAFELITKKGQGFILIPKNQ